MTCFSTGTGLTRQDTAIMAALRNKVLAGALMAGTSAGTAVQSGPPMLTGGESYYGLRYGVYTSLGTNPKTPTREHGLRWLAVRLPSDGATALAGLGAWLAWSGEATEAWAALAEFGAWLAWSWKEVTSA